MQDVVVGGIGPSVNPVGFEPVTTSITDEAVVTPTQWSLGYAQEAFWGFYVFGQIISWALQAFAIYLVMIWSRRHNKQFDQPATTQNPPSA